MLLSSSSLEQDHSTANITIIIPVLAKVISTRIKLRKQTVIESYACGYVAHLLSAKTLCLYVVHLIVINRKLSHLWRRVVISKNV